MCCGQKNFKSIVQSRRLTHQRKSRPENSASIDCGNVGWLLSPGVLLTLIAPKVLIAISEIETH